MHQSQIRPLTHHSGSSPLNCGETLLSKPDPCMSQQNQSDFELEREKGICICSRKVRRVANAIRNAFKCAAKALEQIRVTPLDGYFFPHQDLVNNTSV